MAPLTLEMAFVPAGYYEQEDEEEFDFGDSSAKPLYQDIPTEVCASAEQAHGTSAGLEPVNSTTQSSPLELELEAEKEEVDDPTQFDDACTTTSSPARGEGGGGGRGLSSTDFPSASPISSVSLNGNHVNQNSIHSPVTFKISTSRQESEESMVSCDGTTTSSAAAANVGGVPAPSDASDAFERACGGADGGASGRGMSCDPEMSRQSKALEVGEDLKVAVSRGNVVLVSKMLDQGDLLV